MRRLLRGLVLALALSLAAVACPRHALAQQQVQPVSPSSLPLQRANFAWDKTLLRASFSFRNVVDAPAPLGSMITNGLPHTIAMRAYVWKDGDTTPTELVARSCRIVYDLWDEVYRIDVTDPKEQRNTAAINLEGVIRQCAEVRNMPVIERSALTAGKSYFLAVIVDVNPVNPTMLGQLRAWITHPPGATGISPGGAIFGSAASLFVRGLGTSLQTLQFRTQTFVP